MSEALLLRNSIKNLITALVSFEFSSLFNQQNADGHFLISQLALFPPV